MPRALYPPDKKQNTRTCVKKTTKFKLKKIKTRVLITNRPTKLQHHRVVQKYQSNLVQTKYRLIGVDLSLSPCLRVYVNYHGYAPGITRLRVIRKGYHSSIVRFQLRTGTAVHVCINSYLVLTVAFPIETPFLSRFCVHKDRFKGNQRLI